jgi:hypothetical protein
VADLTWYRDTVAKDLARFMRPGDAHHFAAVVVGGLSSRLQDLHAVSDRLVRLVEAVARVLAQVDEGDEVHAGELLAEVRAAGDDLHGPLIKAIEEAAQLRTAEATVGGSW